MKTPVFVFVGSSRCSFCVWGLKLWLLIPSDLSFNILSKTLFEKNKFEIEGVGVKISGDFGHLKSIRIHSRKWMISGNSG